MKTRVGIAVSCVCVFLFCACTSALKEDWRVLQQSTYGDAFSYDVTSVKHTDNNTITVQAGTNYSKYNYEINCKNNKARILEGLGAHESEWFDIQGQEELLRKAVCP